MSVDSRRVFLYTNYIMTKKDYIAIAKILKEYGDKEHMLLLKFCELFKKDNPNFDADKFINACCK